MKEILFRGMTDDGWVYGWYVGAFCEGPFAPAQPANFIIDKDLGWNEVIDGTVGQFTGLVDSRGNKIFEGDIVRCFDAPSGSEFIAVVEFGNPNGWYSWGWQLRFIRGDKVNTDILCWIEMEETGALSEVIGNIHQSEDLLK